MKLNKIAVATALAGISATPFAHAENTITLSGQVAIGILASDADDVDAINVGDILPDPDPVTGAPVAATLEDVVDAATPGSATFFGDDATININAVGTLNNGLTGYANYRTDLGLVGDTATGDNIHLGIRGDFGDIRLGEVPDAVGFGQVVGDILADSDIDQENAGISYTGTFGGFTVGVNGSPEGSSDRYSAGAKFSFAGFGIGAGYSSDGDGDGEDRDEFSVGATYSIAGVSLAAQYVDLDQEAQHIGLSAGYGWNDFTLGATFAAWVGDFREDDTQVRFDVGYDLGSSMNLSARVNVITDDGDNDNGDLVDYRLLLTKAF